MGEQVLIVRKAGCRSAHEPGQRPRHRAQRSTGWAASPTPTKPVAATKPATVTKPATATKPPPGGETRPAKQPGIPRFAKMTASSLISRRAKSSTSAIAVALLLLAGTEPRQRTPLPKRVTKRKLLRAKALRLRDKRTGSGVSDSSDAGAPAQHRAYVPRLWATARRDCHYDRYMAEEKTSRRKHAPTSKSSKTGRRKARGDAGTPAAAAD